MVLDDLGVDGFGKEDGGACGDHICHLVLFICVDVRIHILHRKS